jgi:hypothetical protein
VDIQFWVNGVAALNVNREISFAVLVGKTQLAAGIDPASLVVAG